MKADKYVDRNHCQISGDFEMLRRSSVFSGINLDVVKLFAYLSLHREYQKGEYLIEQGLDAKQAFMLIRGDVEITVHHRDREIVLQNLAQGAFFGELALLAKFSWFFNARATGPVEVLMLDRTAFQKVLGKFPDHKDTLIERIVQLRVDRLTQQTGEMLDRLTSNDQTTTTL